MLSPASRSRLGVCAALAPRKPIRSARVESSVISTRLGLDTAAAKERLRLRRIRLTPATTLRIMTVSVKAALPLIKTCNDNDNDMGGSTPGGDAATPVQS